MELYRPTVHERRIVCCYLSSSHLPLHYKSIWISWTFREDSPRPSFDRHVSVEYWCDVQCDLHKLPAEVSWGVGRTQSKSMAIDSLPEIIQNWGQGPIKQLVHGLPHHHWLLHLWAIYLHGEHIPRQDNMLPKAGVNFEKSGRARFNQGLRE